MFERLKAWLTGKDDVIRTPEDLKRALEKHPELKIFTLPELPKDDLKIYRPEGEKHD